MQKLKPFIAKNKQVLLSSFSESFREIGVGIAVSVIVLIILEGVYDAQKIFLAFMALILVWYISITLIIINKNND